MRSEAFRFAVSARTQTLQSAGLPPRLATLFGAAVFADTCLPQPPPQKGVSLGRFAHGMHFGDLVLDFGRPQSPQRP